MPTPSSASLSGRSLEAAERLFLRETNGETNDTALVAAAERLSERLSTGLTDWFGPYGSTALVTRAVALCRTDHPSLESVVARVNQSPRVMGLAEGAEKHGAAALTRGFVVMLATLIDAIGRLIGDDLAISLLEQSATISLAPDVNQRGRNTND